MNVLSALGAVVVFASVASSPAHALVSESKALGALGSTQVVKADFVQGHEIVAGVPARTVLARAELSNASAQRYFDLNVIVTLGALALASGAFVAAGIAGARRRTVTASALPVREGWREEIMQALEADLAQFTVGLRRAA